MNQMNCARMGAVVVALWFALVFVTYAGPLVPPAGPVTSTSKALDIVDPRTPVSTETTPSGSGAMYVISQPGSYYLTENLVLEPPFVTGIQINADNVSVDLMGFHLDGAATLFDTGVAVAPGSKRTMLRNGTMSAWDTAIQLGEQSIVTNIQSRLCEVGINVGASSIVSDCITETCRTGVLTATGSIVDETSHFDSSSRGIQPGSFTIVRNSRTWNGGSFGGIAAEPTSFGVLVAGCGSMNSGGNGITVGSFGLVVRSVAGSTFQNGIETGSASLVQDCSVMGNALRGIDLGLASSAIGNHIADNGNFGIDASDYCLILDNSIAEQDDGINTGSGSFVTRNSSVGITQTGAGITVGTACRVVENMASQHSIGISSASSATIERNSVIQNITGIGGSGSSRITENNMESNTDYGLLFTGQESLFMDNRISGSGIAGVELFDERNLLINNQVNLNATSFILAENNRVGFIVTPPLSGDITGDTDPDAQGTGTTDPWVNISY